MEAHPQCVSLTCLQGGAAAAHRPAGHPEDRRGPGPVPGEAGGQPPRLGLRRRALRPAAGGRLAHRGPLPVLRAARWALASTPSLQLLDADACNLMSHMHALHEDNVQQQC